MSEIEDDFPVLSHAGQVRNVAVQRELVVVRPWKLRAWVHELTGAELDEYKQPMYQEKDGGGLKVSLKDQNLRLCAFALRDENGNRIYPNAEKGIAILGQLPSSGSEIVAKVANRLNGQDDEKTTGNSGAGQTGDSPSVSPAISSAPSPSSSAASQPLN